MVTLQHFNTNHRRTRATCVEKNPQRDNSYIYGKMSIPHYEKKYFKRRILNFSNVNAELSSISWEEYCPDELKLVLSF